MSDELHPGDSVGPYRLEQRLGGGGFGSVWKARDDSNGKVVAVKVLKTDVYSTDNMRLRSEVELLAATASSRSPHVVKVLGGGVEPQPYVVMEFIDGVDLGRELERRKRIPQMETIRIGQAVAKALSALESVGIIHRDVKPANVMIDVDGVVKLTDFGIAKIVGFDTVTATSQMPMSMAYAAPEVWEGHASHRSDLYALGILLFQCLVGRPPFTGSYAQVYRQHTSKEPDWTLLPEGTVPALRDLVRQCLAKSESDRPENAAAMVAALELAERELTARVEASGAHNLPVHEPQAFGPWLRQAPHPTRLWTFLCTHETTGEKATVEIHFSDDIEYGGLLRKAVAANPKLVPLGAERLLGTNRLVLRPGEAWASPPGAQFLFWVAREELPLPAPVEEVSEEMLRSLARNANALDVAARSEGLELGWTADTAFCLTHGNIHVRRPGLPPASVTSPREWAASLPLTSGAGALMPSWDSLVDGAYRSDSQGGQGRSSLGYATPSSGRDEERVSDESVLGTRMRLDSGLNRRGGPQAPTSSEPTVPPHPGSTIPAQTRTTSPVLIAIALALVLGGAGSAVWLIFASTGGSNAAPAAALASATAPSASPSSLAAVPSTPASVGPTQAFTPPTDTTTPIPLTPLPETPAPTFSISSPVPSSTAIPPTPTPVPPAATATVTPLPSPTFSTATAPSTPSNVTVLTSLIQNDPPGYSGGPWLALGVSWVATSGNEDGYCVFMHESGYLVGTSDNQRCNIPKDINTLDPWPWLGASKWSFSPTGGQTAEICFSVSSYNSSGSSPRSAPACKTVYWIGGS